MVSKIEWISKELEIIDGAMYDHWGATSADYECLDLRVKILLMEVIRELIRTIKEKENG